MTSGNLSLHHHSARLAPELCCPFIRVRISPSFLATLLIGFRGKENGTRRYERHLACRGVVVRVDAESRRGNIDQSRVFFPPLSAASTFCACDAV
jgi:hypothetical protein